MIFLWVLLIVSVIVFVTYIIVTVSLFRVFRMYQEAGLESLAALFAARGRNALAIVITALLLAAYVLDRLLG